MNKNNYGHYTTQKGLISIISNETLWATNIKFLNDEHEFKDALDLIQELILKANITSSHPEHENYERFIKHLKKEIRELDNHVTESVFTLSFSEEVDLLSQWRGYCPENNGYCIVYNIDDVFDEAKKRYSDVNLVKCIYDKEDKKKIIKDTLNKYWNKYRESEKQTSKKTIMHELSWEIMLRASYFKHPSFSEEKEKRIVVIEENGGESELLFREGKYSIIPYLTLKAPKKSITKIFIGPTYNKKLSKKSLEMFLEKNYGIPPSIWKGLDIMFSETPYRPW
jgi:hypothetical protein